MKQGSLDGSTIRNGFEEIHARRRLVMEYSLSPSTAITVVVLDFKDVTNDGSMPECAAMLVPAGKEMDWMYSSEGGQWQLLASSGVMRLILFTRAYNAAQKNVISDQSDSPLSSGVAAKSSEGPNDDVAERKGGPLHARPNARSEDDVDEPKERKRKYADIGMGRKLDGKVRKLKSTLAEILENEDDALKLQLRPLALALTPRVRSTTAEVLDIPFVDYVDNILQRVIVEEDKSQLIGLLRVEDVELKLPGREREHQSHAIAESDGAKSSSLETSWRRRLIFRRMPNLIQTEVLLSRIPSMKKTERSEPHSKHSQKRRESIANSAESPTLLRLVDHSKLVHKYLPPIVAGFVLVSPCLDAFSVSRGDKAKILCVGVGGGALPSFLQKQFPFQIQVVELDEVVIHLATRHFGLDEDSDIHVTVGDGLIAVKDIAARALEAGFINESLRDSWAKLQYANSPERTSSYRPEMRGNRTSSPLGAASESRFWSQVMDVDTNRNKDGAVVDTSRRESLLRCKSRFCAHSLHSQLDPRVHVIVLDVDACDSQLELNSPPRSFLEPDFLLSAKLALHGGGMLAMNVVPAGRKAYEGVIHSLREFFVEVYEIALKDELNRIIFALPSPVCFSQDFRDGDTFHRVRDILGEELTHQIKRVGDIF